MGKKYCCVVTYETFGNCYKTDLDALLASEKG